MARDRGVPLFDRREIMRHWNDSGNFDLNLATKDVTTAFKVHDCLGQALSSLVIAFMRDHLAWDVLFVLDSLETIHPKKK